MEELINIGKLGYRWSVSKSQTGHYVCRIWKDRVINKQTKVEIYSAFGNNVDAVICETLGKYEYYIGGENIKYYNKLGKDN